MNKMFVIVLSFVLQVGFCHSIYAFNSGSVINKVSLQAKEYDAEVPIAWFNLARTLIQEQRLSPLTASRLFGYMGVALYESIVAGVPTHRSLVGQLNGLSVIPAPYENAEYHWPTVGNVALATVLDSLLAKPENTSRVVSAENAFGTGTISVVDTQQRIVVLKNIFNNQFKLWVGPKVFNRSVSFGQEIGNAIFVWSVGDGLNVHSDCKYTLPIGPGQWKPTPPAFATPVQPCWGKLRPMMMQNMESMDAGAPPGYSELPSSQCYKEAKEVYDTVRNLSSEQRAIALFWADNPGDSATPPGHSISILTQVIKEKGFTLNIAAEAYAKVGIAVADAFICCWSTKYKYNVMRPLTYIQKVIDPHWNKPFITDPVLTPAFPEYTSGHSVQSGAAMQVLTDLFGNNYSFMDHTNDSRGFMPRSFSSFFAASNEAAISRLYGGIHCRSAIEKGLKQGRLIGQRVGALQFRRSIYPS